MPKNDTIADIVARVQARVAASKAVSLTKPPVTEKAKPFEPTPEQQQHAVYVEQDIVDVLSKGRVTLGKAFRKQPRFESINDLDADQLKALRFYRAAFDDSERSMTKSALDVRPRGTGGSNGALAAMETRAFGARTLAEIEASLGALVHILRDIALHDLTFTEAAIKRYGGREVDYIIVGKGDEPPRTAVKLKPKSGTHRQIIRDDFFQGLRLLMAAVDQLRPG